MNKTDQSQDSQQQENKPSAVFSYDPKLFSLLQKALLLVSKQKPSNPIKFVGEFMKNNGDDF